MNDTNIINDPTPSPAPIEATDGQAIFDLDTLFGDPQEDKGQGVGTSVDPQPKKQRYAERKAQMIEGEQGGDGLPPLESDIFGDTHSGNQPFRGNMPKNPLEVISKLQSERDKAMAQVQSWEAQVNEYKSAKDFLAELEEDAEVRRAFIAELEPELVKPKNPYDLIEKTLREEFKDFTPNSDEANIFGSKTWLYNRRAEELLQESREKAKAGVPGSLKELRAKRKLQVEEQRKAALKEKQDIVNSMKWTDNTWEGFANWMRVTKGVDWAKMYTFLLRQSGNAPTPLATQTGSSFRNPRGKAFEGLDQFYG